MVGDLILFTFFVVVWYRIIKFKKENKAEFLFELAFYFFIFILTIVFYKISYSLFDFIFDFHLFPSFMGIFSLSFFSWYIFLKFIIFELEKRKIFTLEAKHKTIDIITKILDRLIYNQEDFEKIFIIFFIINIAIASSLLNSFVDVFTKQKILYHVNDSEIDRKYNRLINTAKGDEIEIENLEETMIFLRTVDPENYEKIVLNTDRFVFDDSMFGATAYASFDGTITIGPIASNPFNSLQDDIFFAAVLIHEAEHEKNFLKSSGFFLNQANYVWLKIKCNPITNYQYFPNAMRVPQIYGDEWCAQMSEVKFLRQFNISIDEYNQEFSQTFEDN